MDDNGHFTPSIFRAFSLFQSVHRKLREILFRVFLDYYITQTIRILTNEFGSFKYRRMSHGDPTNAIHFVLFDTFRIFFTKN